MPPEEVLKRIYRIWFDGKSISYDPELWEIWLRIPDKEKKVIFRDYESWEVQAR